MDCGKGVMKRLIFVSTGRCGTTRISQILREKLPASYWVTHQMPFSRLANVIGHILLYTGGGEHIKRRLYGWIAAQSEHTQQFISSDPLTAMILPEALVRSHQVHIVHIVRDPSAFATSLFQLSRRRYKSFIAHNFIPFWQPGIFPLENALSCNVIKKYEEIARRKQLFFDTKYAVNPNYRRVKMEALFRSDVLRNIIHEVFGETIVISESDLHIRAN